MRGLCHTSGTLLARWIIAICIVFNRSDRDSLNNQRPQHHYYHRISPFKHRHHYPIESLTHQQQ